MSRTPSFTPTPSRTNTFTPSTSMDVEIAAASAADITGPHTATIVVSSLCAGFGLLLGGTCWHFRRQCAAKYAGHSFGSEVDQDKSFLAVNPMASGRKRAESLSGDKNSDQEQRLRAEYYMSLQARSRVNSVERRGFAPSGDRSTSVRTPPPPPAARTSSALVNVINQSSPASTQSSYFSPNRSSTMQRPVQSLRLRAVSDASSPTSGYSGSPRMASGERLHSEDYHGIIFSQSNAARSFRASPVTNK